MNEAYVKFGTAKLLKEKGFDWNTDKVYERNLMACRYEDVPMPSQAVACRWLREVHNIFIGVDIGEDLDGEFGYMPFIHILDNLSCPDGKYVPDVDADDICELTPQTYEDAVEAALQYVLTNLI